MGISQEFIDRYQSEYDKNPHSKIFAPLAEAYRKMGQLEVAQNLCIKGLQIHASFASGRLAYAKVLLDLGDLEEACSQLKKATELSPDNILAFHLLGETCLKLKRPREALEAFKMLLFLHPQDLRAQKAVKKWEFLSAEDFSKDEFELDRPTQKAVISAGEVRPVMSKDRDLERVLSLADALTIRNDLERALEVLIDAQMRLGQVTEIETRLLILKRRQQAFTGQNDGRFENSDQKLEQNSNPNLKRQKLKMLLQRINQNNP
jgi:tetratricopeptide (TPR) repeat protein